MTRLAWVAGLVLGVVMLAAGQAGAAELAEVVARVKPSIVGIGTFQLTRRPPIQFRGTGWAVGDGTHVITNAHVLPELVDSENNEFLAVFVGQGNNPDPRRAKQVAIDPQHDLALLKIEGEPLPALALGDSSAVREGEHYAFTGFPIGTVLGFYPATHRGIVSALTPIATPLTAGKELNVRLINRLQDPYPIFQLDATAYPGNSGSPLYRQDDGRVVGVVNMVFVKESKESMLQAPSGITYAIPVEHVRALLDKQGIAYR